MGDPSGILVGTPPVTASKESGVGKRINYSEKKARSCNNGWSILMSLRRSTHMDMDASRYIWYCATDILNDRQTERERGGEKAYA